MDGYNFDWLSIVKNLFEPVIKMIINVLVFSFSSALISSICFIVFFFLRYGINPLKPQVKKLEKLDIKFKLYNLMRWIIVDINRKKDISFKEYGFTFFIGRQGSGKTTSMVEYLNRMKKKHPKCKIITNFKYEHMDKYMTDWRDFMDIRNGDDGVIFAIDEIHSEYSTESWKDFPESLLSEISQQRKQHVKIVSTCQVFDRCAKQLREQAFSVIVCSTYFKRFVFCREYDAYDYMETKSRKSLKEKVRPLNRYNYIMTDEIRNCFDTFEKIKRMRKLEFINRTGK